MINTASTFKGGGVQVAKSFIEECVHFPEHDYHVLLGPTLRSMIEPKQFPGNFTFDSISRRPGENLWKAIGGKVFDSYEQRDKPDCVFTTSGPAYWRPKAPHLMGFNLGHYVYPESPFYKVIALKPRVRWFMKKQLHGFFFKRDADFFVTQTEDVSKRLAVWLSTSAVATVSNTYGSAFDDEISYPNKLPLRKKGEVRLLTLCAYHLHKNLEIIPKVISILAAKGTVDFKFVVTLDADAFEKLFAATDKRFVVNVGPVPVNECPSLYREIDFMFLPTLIECFSANYPEAMVTGTPILTSNLGFAHSVCGDAALYFDPLDAQDAAIKIEKLASDEPTQQELVQRGQRQLQKFPQARARARQYLALCEQLVNNSKPN